jgi:macrolide-specific efflux system membrane fusion protein
LLPVAKRRLLHLQKRLAAGRVAGLSAITPLGSSNDNVSHLRYQAVWVQRGSSPWLRRYIHLQEHAPRIGYSPINSGLNGEKTFSGESDNAMDGQVELPAMTEGAAPSVRTRRRKKHSSLLWMGVIALLAAIAGGGWYGWKTWYATDATRERVATATVQRGDLEDAVTATGTLQPRDFVDVGTQVSGQLKVLKVAIGDTVKAGDLLAEIDPTVFQARVDADRAQLRNQQAQLADKKSQLALAELQQARQRGLMSENATTAEAVQSAEAAVRSLMAQIDAIRAQMEQSESSLRGDEANLNYTKIYAPMAGTVASIAAKQGQTLNANQQAPVVLRIADLSVMTVQAQVSEADVPKLKTGMEVYFTTLGGDSRRWYGTLRQINPTPTVVNNVVLYDALFDVPNTTRELMTQMTAQVFFLAASAKDAVFVPLAALRPTGGGGRRRGAEGKEGERRARGEGRRGGGDVVAESSVAGSGEAKAGESKAGESKNSGNREAKAGGGREGKGAGARSGRPTDAGPASDPRAQFANGRATVRIVNEDGSVEEREVRVGMMNRVSAQILEGLEPGQQVQIGARSPAAAAKGAGAPKFTPRI